MVFTGLVMFCLWGYAAAEVLTAKSGMPEEYVGPSPGTILCYESGDGIEVVVEVRKGTHSKELILEETLHSPDWAIKAGAPAIIKTVYTRTYDDCRIYLSNRWRKGGGGGFLPWRMGAFGKHA